MRPLYSTGISLAAAALLAAAPAEDPLIRPINPESARRWLTPEEPARVFGNTYLVGFGALNVGLIRTSAGLIVIDAGVPQGVPMVEANIRKLGFSVRDVKLILSTEPHWDHAGGLAALARDSGATVVASAAAAPVLRSGGQDPADPQAAMLVRFPGLAKVRVARDGEAIRLGNVTLTAVSTPGHTAGSMSWRWRSCEANDCTDVLFASSLNPIAAPGWRFADHPERERQFRASFATMRKLPCDILFTAHPDQSGGDRKLAALRTRRTPNPFREPQSCRAYADKHEALLDAALRKEKPGG